MLLSEVALLLQSIYLATESISLRVSGQLWLNMQMHFKRLAPVKKNYKCHIRECPQMATAEVFSRKEICW